MKKLIATVLILVMAASLSGCGSPAAPAETAAPPAEAPVQELEAPKQNPEPASETAPETASEPVAEPSPSDGGTGGYELALITDVGTIDDKTFNQGCWEGVLQYAVENGITHTYYQPSEQSDDAYLDAIALAVQGGAKLIVTPGSLFETTVFLAQERYPDTYFVLIDGVPHSADYTMFNIGDRTVCVNYAEEQAGFLAGYAAVKDGSRRLGFIGGQDVPAVVRFGYGFVQGCEYAAHELGLGEKAVTISYHYTGSFDDTPEARAMAASWYGEGVEIIFTCGGLVGNAVMAAAEQAGGKVIGVDVDQSGESPTVITSAMKGLKASVYSCIKDYYDGSFPGGVTLTFEAANGGVGLPMETSVFDSFTKDDYDAVYSKLADRTIGVGGDVDVEGVTQIPADCVIVTEVE